jgi:asparagine synthetase B (glutamine-hydrolysing)
VYKNGEYIASIGYKRYNEKQGLRTNELWEWYQKRIEKNDFKARKEILKDDTMFINVYDDKSYPDNANKILWCDFRHELRFYHLKRMDHIISSYGIELRVPYCDYNFIMNTFSKSFSSKVNQRGNKLLLRDFAVQDSYPQELAFKPKIPMKSTKFNASEHLVNIWKKFKYN